MGQASAEPRVLFVEDEDLVRMVTADLLEDHGFDVTAATTGAEAVILLAENSYDLLLTDITMEGGIDGIGLAQHAREIDPSLPIVFVSGFAEALQRTDAIRSPVAVIAKPYEPDALLATAERLAARRGAAGGRGG